MEAVRKDPTISKAKLANELLLIKKKEEVNLEMEKALEEMHESDVYKNYLSQITTAGNKYKDFCAEVHGKELQMIETFIKDYEGK